MAGRSTRTVVTADFNSDGYLDVATPTSITVNSGSTQLYVDFGDGAGGFASAAAPILSWSGTTTAGAAGDLNGDGFADLALARSGGVNIFVGDGSGQFKAAGVVAASGTGATSILVTDLNADGRLDLVVPTTNGSVSVALGNGNATFATPVAYTMTSPAAVVGGDFNGDGRPDIASVNSNGTVSILLNRHRANPYVTRTGGTLTVTAPGTQLTTVRVAVPTNSDLVRLTVDTPVGSETFWTNTISRLVLSDANVVVASDLKTLPGLQAVSVTQDASAMFATTQHLTTLTVDGTATLAEGGNKMLTVTGLTVGTAGRVDLNDNAMVYEQTTDAGQLGLVRQLIAAARSGGSWTGFGLTSTAARNRPGSTTTLGLMTAAEFQSIYGTAATFAGETIDSTAVLVQYTLYGDADFDRKVDFNDFLRLQNGYGTTSGATFAGGDFDYDGDTDFNDFLALQNNYNTALPAAKTVAKTPVRKTR